MFELSEYRIIVQFRPCLSWLVLEECVLLKWQVLPELALDCSLSRHLKLEKMEFILGPQEVQA